MSLALLNNDVFVAMVLQSIVLAMPFFVGKECLAEGFANHATGNSSMETFFTETGSIITTITVSVYKTATSSSFTAVKTCNAKSAFIAASRDPFNKKSAFIAGSQDSIDTIADFAYDSWGHHLFHNILVHILFGLLIMVMAIGLAFVFRPRIVRHAIIPSKQDLDQLGQALKGAIGTLQSKLSGNCLIADASNILQA
jgi:hypothetical protein